MKKTEILLVVILIFAFAVRIYLFDSPIADWHSWRQADTSSVSRHFVTDGFDILHPRFDDLSNVPSGKDNPNGYRFVEFPLYNLFQAGFFVLFDYFTLEQWGRLVSIFSSLGSTLFLYLIVKKYAGNTASLFTAFFFAFIPYNVYFGRTILPESFMVMMILGGTYFFSLWAEKNFNPPTGGQISNFKLVIPAIIFTASAFLLKPFAIFFTLPMIYLAFRNFGFGFLKKWQLWIFAFLCLLPLFAWRMWVSQYPEGIPSYGWLFNGGDIRFKGAFFYWLFADRLGRLILGYWGIIFFALGIIRKRTEKEGLFFLSFVASSLIYMIVVARGNVQHDYYQILVMPSIAMMVGLGSELLINKKNEYFSLFGRYLLFVVTTLFMLSFGWYFIRDFFNINNPSIIVAGEETDRLLPKNAKIIALYNGDTTLLYHTKRQGWASFQNSIPEMVKKGAEYLLIVNPNDQDRKGFGATYKIVKATSEYLILDLRFQQ